ncbi:MAG: hypothetical protein QOJ89_2627 [bacterium]
MKRKLAGAAVTMLVAGLAGGCGGGDATATATTTTAAGGAPLTKAELIVRADEICMATVQRIRSAAARIRSVEARSRRLAPADQIATFLKDTSLPVYDDMLGRLRDLTPPKRDEQAIDAWIGSLAGAIDTAKADPARYAKPSADDPFDDANARAKRYGMKECAS